MKISEAEIILLFGGKTLLADPTAQVLVVFPEMYKPRSEELQFLKTMFGAMNWPDWEIRYFTSNKTDIPNEFQQIAYILFFGFHGSENLEVSVLEKGESIHFFFPEIGKFQSNHPIKTLVWKALKPYSPQSKS